MIALSVVTASQVASWRDSATLYRRALALNSNSWLIHSNLAVILIGQGDVVGAKHHLQESIRLNPDFAEARYNLGILYLDQFHDCAMAIENFVEAVRIRPGYADAHFYLGKAYIQSKQWRDAESEYRALMLLDSRLAGMLKAMAAGDPSAFHDISGKE